MIEVTDEMIADGVAAWLGVGGGSMREHLTAAYRAMRAHEPKPVDRVQRRPFRIHEEEEIIPGSAGHMDAEPPGSQWNWENLTRQQKTAVLSREKPSPFISPLEGAAGRMFNDPAMAEMDRRLTVLETKLVPDLQAMVDANGGTWTQRKQMNRRIDALTALVLLMVGRYQPHDGHEHEELKRLVAELEAANP